MDAWAKLITAIAELLAAVAWPAAFLVAVVLFRRQFFELLGRLRKGKVGFVELELERASVAATGAEAASGAVTAEQVHLAARIESHSADIGEAELLRQLDRLCIEYETLRRTLPSGPQRTGAMTRVVVQMRAIAASVAHRVDVYKSSGTPGSRLAAVAIMQMKPEVADLSWLVNRFREDVPFIFFHAALALQNCAIAADEGMRRRVGKAAAEALEIVSSFKGVPDQNSIDVLEPLARLA